MALLVLQIMAQLQEGVDAKGAEAEEKGDKAVDDEAEKMIAEAEDRVAKAWVPSDIKLEIVDGEKEGSRWLIVDDTHICYQNNVKGKKGENRRWKVDSIRWECSKRRHMGCPFQIFTSLPENGAPIKALSMKKPQVHTCSAEKLTPLMHKFRLKLASRMEGRTYFLYWASPNNFFTKTVPFSTKCELVSFKTRANAEEYLH